MMNYEEHEITSLSKEASRAYVRIIIIVTNDHFRYCQSAT